MLFDMDFNMYDLYGFDMDSFKVAKRKKNYIVNTYFNNIVRLLDD